MTLEFRVATVVTRCIHVWTLYRPLKYLHQLLFFPAFSLYRVFTGQERSVAVLEYTPGNSTGNLPLIRRSIVVAAAVVRRLKDQSFG